MIWCLEDDASIRDIVLYTLTSTGFEARGFERPEEFWEAINTALSLEDGLPELLILDIMLPGEDGVEVLRKLKADPLMEDIPVIMATAKGMEFDKVKCLEIGADDYLVKPFGMMEMVARVKALLRRSRRVQDSSRQQSIGEGRNEGRDNADSPDTYTYGNLCMSISEHEVFLGGKTLNLTFKEFELLRFLLANPRQVFTRDQLFDNIWSSDYMGETRTVDMHIKTLRQKLGDYADIIGTVRGVGYRLEVGKHDK